MPVPIDDQLLSLDNYRFHLCIGKACDGAADVFCARNCVDGHAYAVRVVPLETDLINLEEIEFEVRKLRNLKHPNLMYSFTSFMHGSALFVILPLMDYGSVTDMMSARFMFGLPELLIAHIIRDVLLALQYLHYRDVVHRSIRGSHVYVSSIGAARLGGLRHATSAIRSNRRGHSIHHMDAALKNTLMWLAPEILRQDLHGYSYKSDVYSVGITACEMANGFPPFADMQHMQMLYEKLRGTTPRLLDTSTLPSDESTHVEQKKRSFSAAFHEFTDCCLKGDVSERSSVVELMDHPFIKQLKKSRQSWNDLLCSLKPIAVPTAKSNKKYDKPAALEALLHKADLNTSIATSQLQDSVHWSFS